MNPFSHASVSAIYPLSMIQFAVERGVSAQRILNNADLTALSALLKANPVAPVKPALLQGNQIFEKVEIEAA
mgnify:CR=1 FL=1